MTLMMLFGNNRLWKQSNDIFLTQRLHIMLPLKWQQVKLNHKVFTRQQQQHISLSHYILYFQTHFFDVYVCFRCLCVDKKSIPRGTWCLCMSSLSLLHKVLFRKLDTWLLEYKFLDTALGEKVKKNTCDSSFTQQKRLNTRNSSRNMKQDGAHLSPLTNEAFCELFSDSAWVTWALYTVWHACVCMYGIILYVGVFSLNGWTQSGRPICATEEG